MSQCTILVNSCDQYEDTWYPFFTLFAKFWPDCEWPIVLNSETKSFSYPTLNILTPTPLRPSKYYGERLLEVLNTIDTPYVFLLLDDFFIRKEVKTEQLETIINWMETDKSIVYFNFEKLIDAPESAEYPGFCLLPPVVDFKLNLQASIWRKDMLIALWKPKETPWQWEVLGSTRAFFYPGKFYALHDMDFSPIDYGKKSGLTWGIVRGKWYKQDVVPLFEKHNISVDYNRRGFYISQTQSTSNTQHMSIRQVIYSLGIFYYLSNLFFVAINRIRHYLFNEERMTFEHYLAIKKNP